MRRRISMTAALIAVVASAMLTPQMAQAAPVAAVTSVSAPSRDLPRPANPAWAGPTATASPLDAGQGYVNGTSSSDPTSDWGNEANLSSSSHRHSNYTILWQAVLWANGLLTDAGVDGDFGPQTTAATKSYQSARGLPVTGVVDSTTRNHADNYIRYDSASTDGEYVRYYGATRNVFFHRHGGGYSSPYIYDIDWYGQWHGAWYNSCNFTMC